MRYTFLVVALLASGCAYHNPTQPTPPPVVQQTTPAVIRVVAASRSDQRDDIVATVLTADGHFVPNVVVTFAIDSGSIAPGTATTNANGVAQAVATPTTAAATITVSGASLSSSTTITGAPPPPLQPSPPVPPTVTLPPAAVQLAPVTTTVGASTLLTVGAFMGGQAIAGTAWNFGDGVAAQTSGGSTTHIYAVAGSYTAVVTAIDAIGRVASSSALVTVNAVPAPIPPPPAPPPALAATLACTAGTHGLVGVATATACNASVTYGGVAMPSGSITAIAWDWADGNTSSTKPTGSNTYAQAGTYVIFVTVIATTADGPKTTTTTRSVTIP